MFYSTLWNKFWNINEILKYSWLQNGSWTMQLITVALIIIARGTYISQREGSITVTSYLARSADEINALWVTFKFSFITRITGMSTSATKEVGRAWADRPCRYTLITLVTLCDVSPLFRESPPWDPWVNDADVNVGIKPPQTRLTCVRAVRHRRQYGAIIFP